MIKKNIKIILEEISQVLNSLDEEQVEVLVGEILKAKKIVVCGAGRVGMAIRGFGMRLGHFGFRAYTLGDSTVPAIGKKDLFIVASGSGETQTIYDLVKIAKDNKARVALITGNLQSRMGKLADIIVELKAPSKIKPIKDFKSVQPMTTLNEQCLSIFFDAAVLKIMEKTDETHEAMWARHSNLE